VLRLKGLPQLVPTGAESSAGFAVDLDRHNPFALQVNKCLDALPTVAPLQPSDKRAAINPETVSSRPNLRMVADKAQVGDGAGLENALFKRRFHSALVILLIKQETDSIDGPIGEDDGRGYDFAEQPVDMAGNARSFTIDALSAQSHKQKETPRVFLLKSIFQNARCFYGNTNFAMRNHVCLHLGPIEGIIEDDMQRSGHWQAALFKVGGHRCAVRKQAGGDAGLRFRKVDEKLISFNHHQGISRWAPEKE
jgi:hypothetical protein